MADANQISTYFLRVYQITSIHAVLPHSTGPACQLLLLLKASHPSHCLFSPLPSPAPPPLCLLLPPMDIYTLPRCNQMVTRTICTDSILHELHIHLQDSIHTLKLTLLHKHMYTFTNVIRCCYYLVFLHIDMVLVPYQCAASFLCFIYLVCLFLILHLYRWEELVSKRYTCCI